MDKLQEMKDYMQQNQLRKVVFGGYKKEDVQLKFDMLTAMLDDYVKENAEKESAMRVEFENTITQMKQETDSLIAELNKNIEEITSQNQNMEQEHSELRRTVDALTAENEQIVQEQYKIKEVYKTYCGEITKRYSESLDALSGEFNKMLDNVSAMQKSISEDSIVEGLDKALEMLGSKDV